MSAVDDDAPGADGSLIVNRQDVRPPAELVPVANAMGVKVSLHRRRGVEPPHGAAAQIL